MRATVSEKKITTLHKSFQQQEIQIKLELKKMESAEKRAQIEDWKNQNSMTMRRKH